MIDISLYLLIWGEAANLRHVPECICFLFHQMRLELWAGAAVSAKTNRPPGWFLSKVIAPLYRLMRLEMKKTAESGKPMGHTRGCNYYVRVRVRVRVRANLSSNPHPNPNPNP